jgi:hypothetical protein
MLGAPHDYVVVAWRESEAAVIPVALDAGSYSSGRWPVFPPGIFTGENAGYDSVLAAAVSVLERDQYVIGLAAVAIDYHGIEAVHDRAPRRSTNEAR